eukprot:TRINITY_DN349_c0_g1_i1.p1 TRINITY_DN349_c0_g1~~TRINITY_DN349_c0_g1_i1.p1  ORF type:complete len:370 (+),score=50.20 TRINITY_DN349_c0_g1_i1:996-2105(+)
MVDEKCYRLKGCGNMYDGFPFAKVDHHESKKQIRGCAFSCTTLRELYYSNKINSLLKPHGFETANKPIGWWVYDVDVSPSTEKAHCILFETSGNKRLGDNVLFGLESLLPHITKFSADELLKHFPEERRDPTNDDPYRVFETYIVTFTGDFGGEKDFYDVYVEEVAPISMNVDPKYDSIWKECCNELQNFFYENKSNKSIGSLLAYTYWRFGREIGAISRILKENNVSWGTYEDILGFHCNSHVNNLVLLPPNEDPNAPLLSPLDFDMAFCKETFVGSASKWDECVATESNAIKVVLGGDPELNSGATAWAQLPSQYNLLRFALRDTLLKGFLSSYSGSPDAHPLQPSLHKYIHSLLKLALIQTTNQTA